MLNNEVSLKKWEAKMDAQDVAYEEVKSLISDDIDDIKKHVLEINELVENCLRNAEDGMYDFSDEVLELINEAIYDEMLIEIKGEPMTEDEIKKEKYECMFCGCYFMVDDRSGFICPNCEENK